MRSPGPVEAAEGFYGASPGTLTLPQIQHALKLMRQLDAQRDAAEQSPPLKPEAPFVPTETFDRSRVLHYLKMLDDTEATRRAAAARGLAQYVKQCGVTWDAIVVKVETVAGREVPIQAPAREWPHMKFAAQLLPGAIGNTLTRWEREFLINIQTWNRPPTAKQADSLRRMYDKYRSRVNGLEPPMSVTSAVMA